MTIAFLLLVAVSLPGARPADWCARHVGHPNCSTSTPAPAGWQLVFDEPFDQVVARGDFPAAVSDRWAAYPCCWTKYDGTYDPQRVVSWHSGVMDYWLHAEDGRWLMAAAQPILDGSGTAAGKYQTFGRYELTWRADALPGYYLVPLLWPQGEDYLALGEIDWPEGALTSRICGFVHHTGAADGGDQDAYCTTVPMAGAWHTTVTEWTPGSVKLFLDGALIGHSTERIPDTPMRWVIQATVTPTGLPPAGTSGHIQFSRARVWSYVQ